MFKNDPNRIDYSGRPSVCRACGALIASAQNTCGQCGSPISDGRIPNKANAEPFDSEAFKFARSVLNRPYLFTIVFLIANFFVFLLMWSSSATAAPAVLSFPENTLLVYGAKLNSLINAGQWWRIVTPVFIHVGVVHLLVNMYSLWIVGPYVEKLYGSAKFVLFWVFTGTVGVAASYLTVQPSLQAGALGRFIFKVSDSPSAGASGALFGLVGILFVFGIRFRRELPAGFQKAFGAGLLPTILINLFIGYLGEGFIDNAAHLGGFLSGCLVALVVGYEKPGSGTGVALFWRVLQVSALAFVGISFIMVARHFRDPLPAFTIPEGARTGSADLGIYADAINSGQEAFAAALYKGDTSNVDSALAGLDKASPPDEKAKNLVVQLKSLIVRARELASKQKERHAEAEFRTSQRMIQADFDVWQLGFRDWVNTEGPKYGLSFKELPK